MIIFSLSDYDSTLLCYYKSFDIYQSLQDALKSSYLALNIGIIFKKKGNYEEALKYSIKAAKLMEKMKKTKMLWSAYTTIGNPSYES